MSKSNIEILESFLSADTSVLENSNADILQEISTVVDKYLEGETEEIFNRRIEQVLLEENSHAEYLRDLVADDYFIEDTNDAVKSKIITLSNTNPLLKNELDFRTDIKKLHLIETRDLFKKKLQELTELEVSNSNIKNIVSAASTNKSVSYFKPLAITASVLLVVFVGYFILRNPQQTKIAKVDIKKNIDSIAIPEYKKMIIINIGNESGIGFAGDGKTSITDSLVVGLLQDTVNAYKLWNDTLLIKTFVETDSIKVIREISKDSNKFYLKINADKYQIMETEDFLNLGF